MVTDALVEAGDDGQLHGHLQVDPPDGVALEDRLDELLLQAVEVRVHVVDRRRLGSVVVDEGSIAAVYSWLGLLAHRRDDAAQLGVEVVAPDPPRRLADVAHRSAERSISATILTSAITWRRSVATGACRAIIR